MRCKMPSNNILTFATGLPTVVVDKVSVVYDTATSSPERKKEASFARRAKSKILGRDLTVPVKAIDNFSLVAQTGEFIGLLGQNGAGKSTILRVIAGVETPRSGKVYSATQPALLGVQAALLPELSGLENARLGMLAIGMTPEKAESLLPEIIEFSALGQAIHRPMKTYSSGMGARLRFAISTAARPSILLIDEALSTGDATFQDKSRERMDEMLDNAGTIFLVSHTAKLIEDLCNRAIWLHEGRIIADGNATEVAQAYRWWAWCVANGDHEKAERAIKDHRDNFIPQRVRTHGKPGLVRATAPKHRRRD